MQSKLTLRLEEELINKAKKLARKRGKSLSRMVAEYFSHIIKEEYKTEEELPPIVKSIYGSMANLKIDEADYKKYLEDKYS